MSDITLPPRNRGVDLLRHIWTNERVWLFCAGLLAVLFIFNPPQAITSAQFAATNLMNVAPFLILSIGIAA